MFITLWVTSLSMLLIVGFEKDFAHYTGSPLPRWRRYLIPLPIILMVGSNLDGVLSLQAWLETHPHGIAARYSENQAWNADRFATAGLLCTLIIPFLLCRRPLQSVRIALIFWVGHLFWFVLVLAPLLLGTGFPFKQD